MTASLARPVSRETLLLWVMHRFARAFEDHAILKGGMALRLWSSPRATNDIDYVLVPFESKSEVAAQIRAVLTELPGADVQVTLHSTMVRAEVRMDGAAIQIEASVVSECPSEPMATGDFARALGAPSQIVRVMTPSVALAHKLAAWNERRLLRDLYDSYFLIARVGASPDRDTLTARLQHVRSRLPQLRRMRAMSLEHFCKELQDAAVALTDDEVAQSLAPLLPLQELAGLATRMRAALVGLVDRTIDLSQISLTLAGVVEGAMDPGQHAAAVAYVVRQARAMLALRRAILFGSRARGDARPDSDIDIAIEHDSDDAAWAAFVTDVCDNAPTLLDIDLVDLRRSDAKLRARVLAEGTVLHG